MPFHFILDSSDKTTYINAATILGTTVFIGTGQGVFKSTDYGVTWTKIINGVSSSLDPNVTSFTTYGKIIYAVIRQRVFHMLIGGDEWSPSNFGINSYVNIIANSGSNLFAGTDSGVYLSTNEGASWSTVDYELLKTAVYALATSGSNIYAGTSNSIFRSGDNGSNWQVVNNGLPTGLIRTIAVSSNRVFLGIGTGIFLSNDEGASWLMINDNLLLTYINRIFVSSTALVVGTNDGIWTRSLNDLPAAPATPMALAGTNISEIGFRANWTRTTDATSYILDIAIDSTFSLFISGFNGRNVGDTSNFSISGLAPYTRYFYRIRAIGAGGASYFSNTITVVTIETIPPTISQQSASGGTVNQPLSVSVQISDNSGVASAALHYRKGGEAAFISTSMISSASNYISTIPADSVTAAGVEYYIKAVDVNGNCAKYPAVGYACVQVGVTGDGLKKDAAQPAGSGQAAYRLVSFPLYTDSNDAGSLLADDLGEFNPKKWRLFELLAEQTYQEGTSSTTIKPGFAYWLITKESDKILDTGPGKSAVTNTPFEITLHNDWNFISNPYAFAIPVSRISLASGDSVVLRSFAGSWNNTITSPVMDMKPFDGYAIHISRATKLYLNGDLTLTTLHKSRECKAAWWIGIEARSPDAADVDNIAMVVSGAKPGWDRFDLPEPPVIGDYMTLHFLHPEWEERKEKYCVDAKPDIDQSGEIWEFEVQTAGRASIELAFNNLESVPQQYQVLLLDDSFGLQQDLRSKATFRFNSAGNGISRSFALVAAPGSNAQRLVAARLHLPENYSLSPNFPNPFNPTTNIIYLLPKQSRVWIRIFSVLGQEIAALAEGVVQQGYQMAQFDGRSHANGAYLVQLRAEPLDGSRPFTAVRKILLLK